MRLYFDYAAGTPIDPEVYRAMVPYFKREFGNPGSLHSFGQKAQAALDSAREDIARALGIAPREGFREIIFTGSATEANNLALRGAVKAFARGRTIAALEKNLRPRIVVSAIEHESVLETARDLEHEGVEVRVVPALRNGKIDVAKLKKILDARTILVSVMYANNELGTIQPIKEISAILQEAKKGGGIYPLFHTDAAQAVQFLDCNPRRLGVDSMTISAHKIYGPKGAGALYIRDGGLVTKKTEGPYSFASPHVTGGRQEFGYRSGTENIPAVVGFGKAALLAQKMRLSESKRIRKLAAKLFRGITSSAPGVELNGAIGEETLPNIVNVSFLEPAADLLVRFDLRGLAVSAGSACAARSSVASRVVEVVYGSKERAQRSVRFSIGKFTTEKEIDSAIRIVRTSLKKASQ